MKKDRAELRSDIHNRASKNEIGQDRQEIRDDARKIADNKKDLLQSQTKLNAARHELKDDLRRR